MTVDEHVKRNPTKKTITTTMRTTAEEKKWKEMKRSDGKKNKKQQ